MTSRFGLLVVVLATLVTGCGSGAGEVVGQLPWSLVAVSPDARALEITHEFPHCGTERGRPVVREDEQSVRISVPEVRADVSGDLVCTADLRFGTESVRLSAPLGRRTLSQPGREPAPGTKPGGRHATPGARDCARLDELAVDAPARHVPWVARRVEFCQAPIAAAAQRLPILRRGQTADDRLPSALQKVVDQTDFLLRPEAVRRMRSGVDLYLVPGPETTCLGRIREGQSRFTDCQPTDRIGRRGLYAATDCTTTTPKRISLIGLVPAGTDRVRLQSKRGKGRTVEVRDDGVWTADDVPYPPEIRYGKVQFTMTYEKRACYY